MKPGKLVGGVVTVLALTGLSVQAQLTLNFSSTAGSTIQFNGTSSSFQFNPSANQWQIGSEVGGTGSALGMLGMFDSGPFNYGPITTQTLPGLTYEYADVTGPLGGVSINDGVGYVLTGDVDWIQVATANYSGAINGLLSVNVTSLSYLGSDPDLLTLLANASAAMNLTFQFAPGKTLSQLTTGTGPYSTSFSGSISNVPEPSAWTLALLGLVVCGLGVSYRRKVKPAVARSKRQNKV